MRMIISGENVSIAFEEEPTPLIVPQKTVEALERAYNPQGTAYSERMKELEKEVERLTLENAESAKALYSFQAGSASVHVQKQLRDEVLKLIPKLKEAVQFINDRGAEIPATGRDTAPGERERLLGLSGSMQFFIDRTEGLL